MIYQLLKIRPKCLRRGAVTSIGLSSFYSGAVIMVMNSKMLQKYLIYIIIISVLCPVLHSKIEEAHEKFSVYTL